MSSAALTDNYHLSAPFTQSSLNYLLLFLVFGGPRQLLSNAWKHPLWKYAAIGALDVWGNWLVVKSYSLTTITSVTLLDSWTIPCVMLLTLLMLGTRYAYAAAPCSCAILP